MVEVTTGTAGFEKGTKSSALFTDEKLDDIVEHPSSSINLYKIKNKSVAIKTTHTGTITDYFVVVKIQSADEDADANYRTIVEHEIEDDFEGDFPIEDSRKYFRITVQADEGDGSNYITVNASVDALGE